MPRPCLAEHALSPDVCHFCKLAAENPRYAEWGEQPFLSRPRHQIDPNKPRLPKGVPP